MRGLSRRSRLTVNTSRIRYLPLMTGELPSSRISSIGRPSASFPNSATKGISSTIRVRELVDVVSRQLHDLARPFGSGGDGADEAWIHRLDGGESLFPFPKLHEPDEPIAVCNVVTRLGCFGDLRH